MPDTEKLIEKTIERLGATMHMSGAEWNDILREFAAAVWEAKVRDAIDAQTEPPDPDDLVRNPDGTILKIPL